MKLLIRLVASFLLLTILNQPLASAHPGHGDPQHQAGLMHYISSPVHWAPVATVAAVFVALFIVRRIRGGRHRAAGRSADQA